MSLPAAQTGIAIELSARLALPSLRDPLAPTILRRLIDDRHERCLRAAGLAREARELAAAKRAIARDWLRILDALKHDIQVERCALREPYPDLAGYEFRWRWNMARLRLLLWLHFAGVRGLEGRCQELVRPLLAAVRPASPVVPIA